MKTIWNIRSFLIHELWYFRARHEQGKHAPWSIAEIDAELSRRDEIIDKRRDRLRYPELSHS